MGQINLPGLMNLDPIYNNPNNSSGQWGLQPIFQQANMPYVNTAGTAQNNYTPTYNNNVLGVSSSTQASAPQPQTAPAPTPQAPRSIQEATGDPNWGHHFQAPTGEWFNTESDYRGETARREQEAMRNNITSAWDSYLGGLNEIGNSFLPQQQTAQQGIAQSQYEQGQNQLNSAKATSLKDIAANTRNAFQAGNIYLGARGAGDSSAADQYSFAINQQAAKQGSDLNQFVTTKQQELKSQYDQQINSIASWFAQAQQQLKQQIAQGGLGKQQDLNALSQNILNQALQAANQLKADTNARYNGLLTWAANNSTNIGQLQQNIAGIPQAMGMPQIDSSSGNFMVRPVGQSGDDTRRRNGLFG